MAQRGEQRLDHAHADVFRVHEHEEHEYQRRGVLPVHGDQPRHVDRQRDGQEHDDAQPVEQRAVPAFRGRRGRVHVVGLHVTVVQRHGRPVLVCQRGKRHQTSNGHRPRVYACHRAKRHV